MKHQNIKTTNNYGTFQHPEKLYMTYREVFILSSLSDFSERFMIQYLIHIHLYHASSHIIH